MSLSVLDLGQIGTDWVYTTPKRPWDLLLPGEPYVGVIIDHVLRHVIIACRGSTVPMDFLKDVEAGLVRGAGPLGTVALGFYDGVHAAWLSIKPSIPQGYRIYIVGHSLGAAHACLLAGVAESTGTHVDCLMVMGCPAPGDNKLNRWLKRIGRIISIRNVDGMIVDPVYIVPPWCEHPSNPIDICEPASSLTAAQLNNECWPWPVSYHHWQLYLAGIAKLNLPDVYDG
jgi:hypothetical protein